MRPATHEGDWVDRCDGKGPHLECQVFSRMLFENWQLWADGLSNPRTIFSADSYRPGSSVINSRPSRHSVELDRALE
jgi:hypothetical protein